MLKRIHKPTNVDQFLKFARLAKDYPEIFVSINFILGMPEERFEQMRDSLDLAVRSRCHWHNFYIYQHLKNTEFYIAYGGMGDDYVSKDHGRENTGPLFKTQTEGTSEERGLNLNPVRGGKFMDYQAGDAPTGYDVFEIEPTLVPPRAWVREVWFTFNTVANFLLNPAVTSESEVQVRDMIRWLDVLGRAYPQDASMACLSLSSSTAPLAPSRRIPGLGRSGCCATTTGLPGIGSLGSPPSSTRRSLSCPSGWPTCASCTSTAWIRREPRPDREAGARRRREPRDRSGHLARARQRGSSGRGGCARLGGAG